jgi:hypothetical protein
MILFAHDFPEKEASDRLPDRDGVGLMWGARPSATWKGTVIGGLFGGIAGVEHRGVA